jgi:hypothetical protein
MRRFWRSEAQQKSGEAQATDMERLQMHHLEAGCPILRMLTFAGTGFVFRLINEIANPFGRDPAFFPRSKIYCKKRSRMFSRRLPV